MEERNEKVPDRKGMWERRVSHMLEVSQEHRYTTRSPAKGCSPHITQQQKHWVLLGLLGSYLCFSV